MKWVKGAKKGRKRELKARHCGDQNILPEEKEP
jgi:hypothetical protein